MEISITGKHIDIGASLQQHIRDHLAAATAKYFDRTIDAHVVMTKQGVFFESNITMLVGTQSGLVIKSSAEADDPYVAFDLSTAKLAKQLRRYKRRLKDHHNLRTADAIQAKEYVVAANGHEEEHSQDAETLHPAVIAEMPQNISAMAVRDAVMHMDLSNQTVYFFKNTANDRLNAVYRRPDGNIGWIDPGLKTA
jgi:ribosomal subunit interface protein